MSVTKLTKKDARKVLEVVDAGLVSGLGKAKPGHMCVEAAICFAQETLTRAAGLLRAWTSQP